MGPENRRRATRVAVVAVASLEAHGALNNNNQGMDSVRNLSRTVIGLESRTVIGLETCQPPIKGQGVILRLSLGDEIIELATRATRVERQGDSHFYQVGLDWSDCAAAELSLLDEVLGAMADEPTLG